MKKIVYVVAVLALLGLGAQQASAQMGKKFYISAGWQFNAPLSNPVSSTAQGYGAFLEGGYFLTPHLAVGGFMNFSNNEDYIAEDTYHFDDNQALTTDIAMSLYQVPFGGLVKFRTGWKEFQPFVQAKIGANYSSQSTYMSRFMSQDKNWGLYLSPELGLSFFPFYKYDIGFSLSVYYSYATNKGENYDFNGLNNAGFKIGIVF